MTTTRELALTQLEAVFAQDWNRLETLYDPDVRYLDPDGEVIGRTAVTDRMKELTAALPECTYRIRECTAGDDSVVVEWELDGAGLTLAVATAYRTRNGLIAAERNYWDNTVFAAPPDGDARP